MPNIYHIRYLNLSPRRSYRVGIILCILQTEKLKLRKVKVLLQLSVKAKAQAQVRSDNTIPTLKW